MINFWNYLLFFAVLSIYFGQIIDWYSYHIKKAFLIQKSPSIMSVANWVQYTGRIASMIGVFSVSFMFEAGLGGKKIELVFLIALSLAALTIGLGVKIKALCRLPYFLQRIICLNLFGDSGEVFFWRELKKIRLDKMLIASLFVNIAMIIALVAPIYAASLNSNYRMTFVYCGQFLNFISSIIMFAYIDRILYKDKDKSVLVSDEINSVIWGKVIASILVPILLLIDFI